MSTLKQQLSQLLDIAITTTGKLSSCKVLAAGDVAALRSSMNAMLPLAERVERLLRTVDVNGLEDLGPALEQAAIDLWNAAALASKVEEGEAKKLMCSVKLSSCLLCEVHELLKPSLKEKFRSLNCLYRTLRMALDQDSIEMGSKIQEHADRMFKSLESMSSGFEEDVMRQFRRIKAELFITKMQFSILEEDVQMAKFYEERAQVTGDFDDSGEVVSETLRMIYNSSLLLYQKEQHEDAIYFLQRAMKLSGDCTSDDKKSIKTSLCFLLARSCIEVNTEESLSVASDAIQTIEAINSAPNIETFKLGIQLNKCRDSTVDMEDVIMRMVMTVPIIPNLKQILSIINEHSRTDPQSAIKCFDYIFTNRLEPTTDQDALEMLFTAMVSVHMKDKETPAQVMVDRLSKFFDDSERIFIRNISKKCSSASVTLLWTSGKTESKNNNFGDAIGWFRMGLHRVLQVNEVDKGKFQRALQNCYIQLEDFEKAEMIYDQMSPDSQNSLITQYNNFKIFCQQNNEPMMLSTLKKICHFDERNVIPLLSLCALNCEINTRVAIQSMMHVFQKVQQSTQSSEISLSNTLKFVIELILKQGNSICQTQYKDSLLTLFQEAHSFAQGNLKAFTISDLKWFSANAFNAARDCILKGDFISGELFSCASSSLNSLIKDDISISESMSLKLWSFRSGLFSIMCHSQLKDGVGHDALWSDIRIRALNLRITIDEMIMVCRGHGEYVKYFKKDWEQCLLDCMIFQYQAEIELGNQNAVESLIQEASKFKNADFDSTLVNVLWSSSQPSRLKTHVLSLVIERHLGDLSTPCVMISRWVRLLLKQESSCSSDQETQRVISQLIMRLNSQGDENRFPVHEIEWMSTKCWNIGIGFIFQSDRNQGSIWCNYAMRLSRFVNERFEATLSKLWDELV